MQVVNVRRSTGSVMPLLAACDMGAPPLVALAPASAAYVSLSLLCRPPTVTLLAATDRQGHRGHPGSDAILLPLLEREAHRHGPADPTSPSGAWCEPPTAGAVQVKTGGWGTASRPPICSRAGHSSSAGCCLGHEIYGAQPASELSC